MKVWKQHITLVDQFGNAVSATTTLNAGYGSNTLHALGFLKQ
jgi:gamma-glutamyltranspeptidase